MGAIHNLSSKHDEENNMRIKTLTAALAIAGATAFTAAPAQADASTDYLGQITTVGFNFCPRGTLPAEGGLLPISQYTALFSLLGTTYGGDGRTTFGLPDLRGRTAIGSGNGPGLSTHALGAKGGQERVQLTTNELPAHAHTGHTVAGTTVPNQSSPVGHSLADYTGTANAYTDAGPAEAMANGTIQTDNTGGSQPHYNMQPYLAVKFCINSSGIYPSRS